MGQGVGEPDPMFSVDLNSEKYAAQANKETEGPVIAEFVSQSS